MNASYGLPAGSRRVVPLKFLHHIDYAIGLIPTRLRHRRFWEIQALVVLATAAHYGVEVVGFSSPEGTLHEVTITLYMLPLLYAAMSFGWEGALMTGLWGAILTSPSTWIWHHSGLHWVAEVAQLAITVFVGILVAWRVDRESKQRQIAETTSASLRLLNMVGETLSHTLEVERQLPQVLKELRSALNLESVVLLLEPETAESGPTVLEEGAAFAWLETGHATSHLDAGVQPRVTRFDERTVRVVLMAESGALGDLAVRAPLESCVSQEQMDLLATVGHEIAAAVENARLYRQRQESMQSYVRQVTQAQEDERLRIARDLHDDTVQELVLLVRRLEQMARDADPAIAGQTEEALAIVRSITRTVRRFSQDLRPSILDDLGLLAAIEMVVEQADKVLSGGATLRISGKPRRIGPHVEVAVFRIAQEALRNIDKHAKARKATVSLRFDSQDVSVAVSDDGVGFSLPRNVSDLARLGKLGVLGMKERAELVGGAFEVHSEAGRGTTVVVTVPSRTE